MENNNTNLPNFMSQTWRKQGDETIKTFHESVKEHVKELFKRGYSVEVRWLNSRGEVCKDEKQIAGSLVCRIVEKKEKSDISNKNTDDWVQEQRGMIKKANENRVEER